MSDTESRANHWACLKCGAQNAATTRLCYACGTADPDHVEPSSNGWLKAILWFVIAVVAGAVVLLVMWSAFADTVR